jgi:hypothetical protein
MPSLQNPLLGEGKGGEEIMETRICTKCDKPLPATNEFFYKCKKVKIGLAAICKACSRRNYFDNREQYSVARKLYWENNKDYFNAKSKQFRLDNPELSKEHAHRSYWKNRDARIERKKQYYLENKDVENAKSRGYYLKHREEILAWHKEYRERPEVARRAKIFNRKYYLEHIDDFRENNRRWRKENRDRKNKREREYRRNKPDVAHAWDKRYRDKVKEEPSWVINGRMSSGIRASLVGGKDGRSWESLVGYTKNDLKKHLEKQFVDGMNWERFMNGEIHIDHIIPKSAFNFITYDDLDFRRCWALDNLQPLWAKDNLSKHAKLEKPFQPSMAFGGKL